jgi:predicted DCC family thiol-disulfide oxidoreductase YuxK
MIDGWRFSDDRAQSGRATVLYDRDCSFCRWSLARLLAWDRRGCLDTVALQEPEADLLLAGIEPRERMESWHLIGSDGEIHSAGQALAPLLRLLPGGKQPARLAEAFPRLTEAGYRLVAGNRSLLSRVVRSRAR